MFEYIFNIIHCDAHLKVKLVFEYNIIDDFLKWIYRIDIISCKHEFIRHDNTLILGPRKL